MLDDWFFFQNRKNQDTINIGFENYRKYIVVFYNRKLCKKQVWNVRKFSWFSWLRQVVTSTLSPPPLFKKCLIYMFNNSLRTWISTDVTDKGWLSKLFRGPPGLTWAEALRVPSLLAHSGTQGELGLTALGLGNGKLEDCFQASVDPLRGTSSLPGQTTSEPLENHSFTFSKTTTQ